MSPWVRWILAIVVAVILIAAIIGIAVFGIMAMAFGSAGCSGIDNDASMSLLIGSPIVMSLGVLAAAVLFGLNKRWYWWVSSLGGGLVLGIIGYAAWFALVASVWCAS